MANYEILKELFDYLGMSDDSDYGCVYLLDNDASFLSFKVPIPKPPYSKAKEITLQLTYDPSTESQVNHLATVVTILNYES